jgi:Fic family protein
MDPAAFAGSPIGHLVPLKGTDGLGRTYEVAAFVADPLPPEVPLDNAAWRAVSRANHALGRLQQAARMIPNPALLRTPTIRREAQSTSALEGTFAPLEEVLAADVIDVPRRSAALREVLNFVEAAEAAFDWLADARPVTVGLLCRLHKILVANTEADTRQAGQIRSIAVAIGSRGGSVEDARFVPMPPGTSLDAAVNDFVDWLRPDDGAPQRDPVVSAAMGHYQFETLHPFNDGNGRLGRLLVVVQLLRDHAITEPLLSVSPWFERRRDLYQDHLGALSRTGDWSPWVQFFAEGIEAAAVDTARRIDLLLDTQERYREQIRAAGLRGAIRDIADLLIGTPFVTISSLADAVGTTYQATSTAVGRLEGLKILSEVTGRSQNRIYRASAVVDVLTSSPVTELDWNARASRSSITSQT